MVCGAALDSARPVREHIVEQVPTSHLPAMPRQAPAPAAPPPPPAAPPPAPAAPPAPVPSPFSAPPQIPEVVTSPPPPPVAPHASSPPEPGGMPDPYGPPAPLVIPAPAVDPFPKVQTRPPALMDDFSFLEDNPLGPDNAEGIPALPADGASPPGDLAALWNDLALDEGAAGAGASTIDSALFEPPPQEDVDLDSLLQVGHMPSASPPPPPPDDDADDSGAELSIPEDPQDAAVGFDVDLDDSALEAPDGAVEVVLAPDEVSPPPPPTMAVPPAAPAPEGLDIDLNFDDSAAPGMAAPPPAPMAPVTSSPRARELASMSSSTAAHELGKLADAAEAEGRINEAICLWRAASLLDPMFGLAVAALTRLVG
ncbi:MAG: hypothetical protein ABIJ09_19670 [Pseudomonadota bacterium]